jgi:iron complex outermembrane recepter protein
MSTKFLRTSISMASLMVFECAAAVPLAQAQAASGSAAAQLATDSSNSSSSVPALAEIVVSAEKVREPELNVPMSLTAISGAQLENMHAFRLEDFVQDVPGVTLMNGGFGDFDTLTIRGISTGGYPINDLVATYIDETPFATEGPFALSAFAGPNLDTFDMQRIEVLKGPQGTLYGANALAGLLKYVTNAPDPSHFASKVEAGVSSVAHGGAGFDTHGMVNLPLTDQMAVRLVGYDSYYPGFIDDPGRGLTGINGTRFVGGRAEFLYQPLDTLSIKATALYQDRWWSDISNEFVNYPSLTPTYGSLAVEDVVAQPGHATDTLYNVTISWDARFARVTSSSSYYQITPVSTADDTIAYSSFVTQILGAPYGGVFSPTSEPAHAFTQEVRMNSQGQQPLTWLVGLYYTHEGANETQTLIPIDTTTRTIEYNFPQNLGAFYAPTTYQEYAAYGNLDYHFTDTFDMAVGSRYSRNNQTYSETGLGILGGNLQIGQNSSQGVATYSWDARWHVTPQSMVYGRIAKGFVPGGPNDVSTTSPLPHSYESSTAINYEFGIKNSLVDNRFTVETDVFLIDFSDIQLIAAINGFAGIVNGGAASSRGVETTFVYVPVRGLKLSLNGAYTDAYLTENTPESVGGLSGMRLPNSPLWGGFASADYERPILGGLSGFVGADVRFTGSRYGDFESGIARPFMPSYTFLDARFGVENQHWSLSFYAKNIANKIALSYVGMLGAPSQPWSAPVYNPRTIGATVTVSF